MSKTVQTPEALNDADLDDVAGGLIINISVAAKDGDAATDTDAAVHPHRFDPYRNFKFPVSTG